MFNLSFENVARLSAVAGRGPAAARVRAAYRARLLLEGSSAPARDRGRPRRPRGGDFSALLALLDPDIVLRADVAAVEASVARASAGAPALAPAVHGPEAVARTFSGRAQAAQLATVDGRAGLVFAPGGQPRVVFDFTVENGRIVEINLIADAASIKELDLEI
jgi:RNA polymerase sigma-70 factor (ECF subfamily)